MRFHIRTSWVADADVHRTVQYIRKRSLPGAISWLKAFEAAQRRLSEGADTFGEAAEARSFDWPIKEIYFKTRRGLVDRL